MARNVVISELDAIMCVVLSKVEKQVTYGEFVGTTEYTGWRKKKACFFFQIIVALFIFNIKKLCQHQKNLL